MNDKINQPHDSAEFLQSDCDGIIKETRCDIADRHLAEAEQDYDTKIFSGLDLVFALANRKKISPDVLNSKIADCAAHDIEWHCPAEPLYDNRCNWLNTIEILSSAEKSLSDLYSGNESAEKLREVIKNTIHARVKTIESSKGWWKFGSLAEERISENANTPEPWNTVLKSDIAKEIPVDSPLESIKEAVVVWTQYWLSERDSEYIKNFVSANDVWRNVYRDSINKFSGITPNSAKYIITVHPSFRSGCPSHVVSLPHTGNKSYLKTYSTDNGILIDYPGKNPVELTWEEDGIINANIEDEIIGGLKFRFERIKPDLHCESFSVLCALGEILRDPDYPEDKAIEVIRPALDLFFKENGWFDKLLEVSNSFNSGDDIERSDILLAERALEIRAIADRLLYRYLNPEIHDIISKLDELLSNVKSAVLAIPPERYHEIIEFADPEPKSWWSARFDLCDYPDHLLYDDFSDQD